jgi:hypothetical protein
VPTVEDPEPVDEIRTVVHAVPDPTRVYRRCLPLDQSTGITTTEAIDSLDDHSRGVADLAVEHGKLRVMNKLQLMHVAEQALSRARVAEAAIKDLRARSPSVEPPLEPGYNPVAEQLRIEMGKTDKKAKDLQDWLMKTIPKGATSLDPRRPRDVYEQAKQRIETLGLKLDAMEVKLDAASQGYADALSANQKLTQAGWRLAEHQPTADELAALADLDVERILDFQEQVQNTSHC